MRDRPQTSAEIHLGKENLRAIGYRYPTQRGTNSDQRFPETTKQSIFKHHQLSTITNHCQYAAKLKREICCSTGSLLHTSVQNDDIVLTLMLIVIGFRAPHCALLALLKQWHQSVSDSKDQLFSIQNFKKHYTEKTINLRSKLENTAIMFSLSHICNLQSGSRSLVPV